MSDVRDGGPAFPVQEPDEKYVDGVHTHFGMSLRDWFAGQAMALPIVWKPMEMTYTGAAERAYQLADAMLTIREQK